MSGEPQNFWCDEAGTATIEDGTVAAMALLGTPLTDEEETIPKASPPPAVQQGDALKELLAASNDLVETIEMMDEDALLALDDDPHPPSSLSACAERLRKAIDAARAAKEGGCVRAERLN